MFPHRHACHHSVLFYQDDASLRDNVAAYVATALRAGEPALVIARPDVRQQLTIELHRQHVQGTPFGATRGAFLTLDAAETLDQLCIDGRPDAARFAKIVGAAFEQLAGAGKRVAAYGEMVGILCERGQYADAVRLEALWNALLATANASLLCGYSRRLFTAAASRGFYDQIRAAHDVVRGEEQAAVAL